MKKTYSLLALTTLASALILCSGCFGGSANGLSLFSSGTNLAAPTSHLASNADSETSGDQLPPTLSSPMSGGNSSNDSAPLTPPLPNDEAKIPIYIE